MQCIVGTYPIKSPRTAGFWATANLLFNVHITTTDKPAKDAGAHISKSLQAHRNCPTLLLLPGGSAMAVFAHITTESLHENLTIMTGDDRYTTDLEGNNFLNLQSTDFYTRAKITGVQFVTTVPTDRESHQEFATRIENRLSSYCATHPDAHIISLQGIGPDGHTAAIYPMLETDFNDTYNTNDALYVPCTQTTKEFHERTSMSPKFLSEKISEVIVYALGEAKRDALESMQISGPVNELPARLVSEHAQATVYTDLELEGKKVAGA